MPLGEEAQIWAKALVRLGHPPWLVVEYLMREFDLTGEEALFTALEAFAPSSAW
jgi:hypothetical protein